MTTENIEDSNVHRFYYCGMVQECIEFLKKAIYYLGGIQTSSLLKMLYLDISKIERRNRNSIVLLISMANWGKY